jgi:hypothetical protein
LVAIFPVTEAINSLMLGPLFLAVAIDFYDVAEIAVVLARMSGDQDAPASQHIRTNLGLKPKPRL